MTSLDSLKEEITSVLAQGEHLRESHPSPSIAKRLNQLNAAWSKLHSNALKDKDALKYILSESDPPDELLAWITDTTARLEEAKLPPGASLKVVDAHLQKLKVRRCAETIACVSRNYSKR